MNKLGRISSKLGTACLILVVTLVVACTPNSKITFCHATGDVANPYEELTIALAQVNDYISQSNNFYPVPANGCPTSPLSALVVNAASITICHATGDENAPYTEVSVSDSGLDGHGTHSGDIIPMPDGGCPTGALVINDGKITICHATSSAKNPYYEITVSVNGLNGHGNHAEDIIPVPADGCPASSQAVIDGKITICHATSSAKKPYNEITVSINGVNGHGNHAEDIIPAPSSGCPTTKP